MLLYEVVSMSVSDGTESRAAIGGQIALAELYIILEGLGAE
jgi:hypothetical protein